MYICVCKTIKKMNKKAAILVPLFLFVFAQISFAKGIRYNYKTNGITHISADYDRIEVAGTDPFYTRVEFVGFPDGSSAYLLYMNFEQKAATNVPKGVKMAVTLPGGKIIRLDQIGTDDATKQAFTRGKNRVYWNRTKYLVEKADMERMVKGIKSLDVITGWDPDDYIQVSFPSDELGKVIASQCKDSISASSSTAEVDGKIDRYSDNSSSLTVIAKPAVAKGTSNIYNIGMSYLYYKNTNSEDMDLTSQIGTDSVNQIDIEAPVVFTFSDGTSLTLRQTRESENFLCLYPTMEDVRKLVSGTVKSISVQTKKGAVTDTFENNSFSSVANKIYQTLMAISVL